MKKLLSFCVVFGLLAGGAQAASIPISLFNTGVDNSGVSLANGAIDHHWLLNPTGANTETPANTQPTVATSAHNFPIPPWLGDSTTSAWITPNAALTGPNDNSGAAGFIYSEAFTTTSDASEVTISGGAGADNNVVGVALDGGAPIVFSNPSGFGALDPYTISGLLIGTSHVIQFYVANGKGEGGGDGYTGFREEFTSAAFTPVPEPGSLAGLLGFGGMSLIGLGWRRRRNALTAYISSKTCDRATLPIIHSLCMKVGVNAMKKLFSFCVVFGLLAGGAQASTIAISLSNTG
jgi:PEP-CTERM motif